MKEKEGIVDCPEQQVILYVEKEDGTYGPVQTGSYITANYLDDYFLKRQNLEKMLKERIRKREINPIGYYMILGDLTLSELASRVGALQWRVKRHLDPERFETIPPRWLRKYARVFNVDAEELVQLANPSNG
jgi:hypothetical protein